MDERLRELRARQAGWVPHQSGVLVPPDFESGHTLITLVSSHTGKNSKPVIGSMEMEHTPEVYDWPEEDLDTLPHDPRIPAVQYNERWVSVDRSIRDAIRSGLLRIDGECSIVVDETWTAMVKCTDIGDAERLCEATGLDLGSIRRLQDGWTYG